VPVHDNDCVINGMSAHPGEVSEAGTASHRIGLRRHAISPATALCSGPAGLGSSPASMGISTISSRSTGSRRCGAGRRPGGCRPDRMIWRANTAPSRHCGRSIRWRHAFEIVRRRAEEPGRIRYLQLFTHSASRCCRHRWNVNGAAAGLRTCDANSCGLSAQYWGSRAIWLRF
jgi:hypothetical protein